MSSKTDISKNEQFVFDFINEHKDDHSFITKLREMIDSINDEEELHQTQKNELDKRLEYYKDNPNDVMDWQDAKTKLLSR
mgnify:CR=1 FL=1